MKLKFGSKSQEFEQDGTVKGTKVTLTNDEGAYYPVMLPADKISLSKQRARRVSSCSSVSREFFVISTKNEKFAEITADLKKAQGEL